MYNRMADEAALVMSWGISAISLNARRSGNLIGQIVAVSCPSHVRFRAKANVRASHLAALYTSDVLLYPTTGPARIPNKQKWAIGLR